MFGARRRARGITVSIIASARELRVVRMRAGTPAPEIDGFESRPLPPEGEGARRKALDSHLRELAPFIGAGDPEIRLVVDTPGVLVRALALPRMPLAEVASTVRLQWSQITQTPFDEMRVDMACTRSQNPRSPGLGVLLAAMSIEELDGMLAPFREAGLTIGAVVPGAVALLMLRCAETSEPGGAPPAEAILDIGFGRSCLVLARGEALHAAREIPTAGHTFTQALRRELDVSPAQAEKLKQERGVLPPADTDASGEEASTLRSIHGALRPVVERLAAEVQRSIAFMQEERGESRPTRLLLTGGGAGLPGLAAMMADFLDIPVEIWDPAQRLFLRGDAERAPQGPGPNIGAMCLGAAIGRPPVNLLSPSRAAAPARAFKPGPLVLAAAYAVLLAAIVGWFWNENRQIEKAVAAQETRMARIPPAERSALALGPYLQARARESVDFRRVFEELYWLVPEDVTLEAMTLKRPASTPVEAPRLPRVLQIEGVAGGADTASERTLARLLEAIEDSPLIRNVQLVRSASVKNPDERGLRFAFTFEIDEAGMAVGAPAGLVTEPEDSP